MLLFSRAFEALVDVHIQEVTGSSPVVPTKPNQSRMALVVLFSTTALRDCRHTLRAEPVTVTADAPPYASKLALRYYAALRLLRALLSPPQNQKTAKSPLFSRNLRFYYFLV